LISFYRILLRPTIIASKEALVVLGFIPTPHLVCPSFSSSMYAAA